MTAQNQRYWKVLNLKKIYPCWRRSWAWPSTVSMKMLAESAGILFFQKILRTSPCWFRLMTIITLGLLFAKITNQGQSFSTWIFAARAVSCWRGNNKRYICKKKGIRLSSHAFSFRNAIHWGRRINGFSSKWMDTHSESIFSSLKRTIYYSCWRKKN